MTPHKFDRVTVTQDMIDARVKHLHPFVHQPGVFVDINGRLHPEHKSDPGNSCIMICQNCGSEFVHSSGYADDASVCPYCKQIRVQPVQPVKHISTSSGLGIGGTGSDDYNMATEGERYSPQFSQRKSSGQLWEPCAKHGCDNEPSCLDCGYCLDKHCHCGEN